MIRNIESRALELAGKNLVALRFELCGVPCIVIAGKTGFIGCGAFNVAAFEKFQVPAAVVRGVKTVDDVLAATVAESNRPAHELGVMPGMPVTEALKRI